MQSVLLALCLHAKTETHSKRSQQMKQITEKEFDAIYEKGTGRWTTFQGLLNGDKVLTVTGVGMYSGEDKYIATEVRSDESYRTIFAFAEIGRSSGKTCTMYLFDDLDDVKRYINTEVAKLK